MDKAGPAGQQPSRSVDHPHGAIGTTGAGEASGCPASGFRVSARPRVGAHVSKAVELGGEVPRQTAQAH
ncbi:protein of unknown function [Blastococcus saxobsidens DD2]|uniref:Uncharacterized protein n=1 Tax=Blastococcus saxobsidens (strain DD2) TaxID=1146883 RepID=H6RMF3_BLASD|nr:protein of unknown function [Blastococcus saxobsidens DD2]